MATKNDDNIEIMRKLDLLKQQVMALKDCVRALVEQQGQNEFLDIAKAADALSSSPTRVYQMIHDGTLGAIKVGRGWRIRKTEINRYINTIGEH